MPLRELITNIAIYAICFALLALYLPWYIFIPIAGIAVFLNIYLVYRRKKRRYHAILQSIRNIKSEAFGELDRASGGDIDHLILESFKEVATELEKRCFQLVEKNIQLLSLKEIGLMIISSLDERKIVDSVTTFLSKGLGFKELFVGVYNQEREVMNLYVFREKSGQHSTMTNLKLSDMDGMVKKAILRRQPVLIKDPAMHPIGSLGGEELFEDSTMETFIIVPLMKSAASLPCWENEDCLLKGQYSPDATEMTLDEARCPSCQRFPILGVVGVTDGFKAAKLSKVDLVSVETLSLQIGTILENTRLYTELKQEESFRENVINSMMNGLLTVDKTGKVVLANETAERITGYASDELIGMRVEDLIVDGFSEEGRSPVLSTLRTGRRDFHRETWVIKKDSSKLPVLLNTSFLLDESKEIQGVLAVFDDITRIKRMEEKIMHLDKLAALGRFSSSIAHEIRNPLTGIAAGIQYLKRSGSITEDQRENIAFILNEVSRIDRLIGDIMSVVRIGDLMYQNIRIETIIKNSIASLHDLAEKKSARIITEYPEESKMIKLDGDRVTQVMINLIKNAIEASNEGGEVTIRASFPQDVSDVLFDDVRDYVIIEVNDRGVGLNEDEKNKVFEPFFSTKQEGTGLGLYVSHSIVERHGGYIFVDSNKDKGTTFTVYLPVEKVQHGESSEVSHPSG
ncbi:MAG: PAS domain S-box protein [Candidatus Latescibacteria bacterium]|nr:PAS domain S-box protein [Candidatus Latescibacterota bacterium]NIM21478.1 PAS domain S-box protein [Candidatus Latescibacterota bacterium]NIM65649.1 PAS domain S-box protein [Candidatus Latescibacterota bacterium]NIO02031.1 PAS domain S-box protein [Candidatus Latescibacterota bacterium]NIO28843.1 PAS domain S-box protein [Candidatus Latescibacterota bacterium]